MELHFHKYQGTGNDFIILDNRQLFFPKNDSKLIAHLCERRFGIGADGLLLLEDDTSSDFKMVYFNSDGNPGSMCGNGGRCLVAFAHALGLVDGKVHFMASDGMHEASITGDQVALKMSDVEKINNKKKAFFLNTGSPHHVQLIKDLNNFEVVKEGRRLRFGIYGEKGSNINFVEQLTGDSFMVRTYERGVEDETFSCGTGVTAVALAMHYAEKTESTKVTIRTKGGELNVCFSPAKSGYKDVVLEGPATFVYKGTIEW